MSRFRHARSPMGRQYQQAAIARAYARQWRPADGGSDLSVFVSTVNQDFTGTATVDWPVTINERRGMITVQAPAGDYRATLRPGALVRDGETYRSITAEDVEDLEFRRSG